MYLDHSSSTSLVPNALEVLGHCAARMSDSSWYLRRQLPMPMS